MSKKTKDETIDFLYIKKKDVGVGVPDDPKQNKRKKANKNKKSKKNNSDKNAPKENDIINLDEELIIGLTPKPEPKKTKKEPKKNIKSNNKKQPNKSKPKNSPQNAKESRPNEKVKPNQSQKSKIRKSILKWTSILILVIGVIILFMLSPIFDIKQINVEGNSKLTSEEIISYSQIQLDINMFKMQKQESIEKIQSNPYVESASIARELPSTIKISIKERVPQYIIEIANGNAYIDSKGYILEMSQEKLPLPIILGYQTSIENIIDFQNTKKLSDEDCKRIEVINKVFESARNNGILTYITSINITNIDDVVLNLDAEQKIAYFGDCSNANLRILYLKKMLEEENGRAGEAYINGNIHTLKPYFREKI